MGTIIVQLVTVGLALIAGYFVTKEIGLVGVGIAWLAANMVVSTVTVPKLLKIAKSK